MLKPLNLPANFLRHVGSFKHTDGRILKIMRWPVHLDPNDDGPLAWQDPMDRLFNVAEVILKPMTIPTGGIFYMDYKYGT